MDKSAIFTLYFFLRLLINILTMVVLIRYIYYNTYQKRDSFFTFYLLNFIVFLLAYMLDKTGGFNSIGSAFGLLAAFSLLRFRTETLTMKDMTYLFLIMALALINSVMKGTYLEIILLNVLILIAVYVVDGNRLIRNQQSKTVEYYSLENIKPAQQDQLIAELRDRTGLDIQKIIVEHIDFGKGKAIIKIYFY
jgi:thiol:disulfide interchange protein